MFFSNSINVCGNWCLRNGKRSITLKDKNGTFQTVVAEDNKIDEFINQKNKIEKTGSKMGWSALGILTLGLCALGAFTGKTVLGEKGSRTISAFGNALGGVILGAFGWMISDNYVINKQSQLAQKFIQDNK